MKIISLSHIIENGIRTFPGVPGPIIGDYLSHDDSRGRYAADTEFQIGKIEMVSNTGTYVDAPFHRFRDGADIARLPLERIANIPGVVIHHDPALGLAIGIDALEGVEVSGRAVLIRTGWDRHFGEDRYFDPHPYISANLCARLVSSGAALIGIDSLNVDSMATNERPVHTALLANEIPIVEHLTNLDRLPADGFRFFAIPLEVRGVGSFPCRAFAIHED